MSHKSGGRGGLWWCCSGTYPDATKISNKKNNVRTIGAKMQE